MSQHYSNPKRADDPYALPDVEVFYHDATNPFGEFSEATEEGIMRSGWYYWSCFPGCLPDSDPIGPYDTEAEAIAAAQEDSEDEPDEVDENQADEPDEDAITTEDHKVFYQYGRQAFEVAEVAGEDRYMVFVKGYQIGGHVDRPGAGDATYATVEDAIKAYMERVQFWPDVWFISDHGNAHRIDLG